jgi:hypothetical protein
MLLNNVLLPLKNAKTPEEFEEIISADRSHFGVAPDMLEFENRYKLFNELVALNLSKGKLQISFIRKGLVEIIPKGLLSVISWYNLEAIVCGQNDIDIELLKRHTEYKGTDSSAPHIKYFWQVLEEFSPLQRCKFVEFAYGQSRIPDNDEEFNSHPKIRMLIKYKEIENPDNVLPRADT